MTKQNNQQLIELTQHINDLEIKISFQEYHIEQLNDVVAKQQSDIDKLNVQLRFLMNKFHAMEPSNIASNAEETPPPHY